ncbi:MAG: enoyl-CoA hydratase/isomerase family protein [Rhodoferax sp.]|nr:enoyl-CoA hydratase/isomerase family protein [Rhodoferax sp.]
MSGHVQLRQDAGIAWVTLAHAGKFNAMSRAMWLQLKAVFQQIQADVSLRCVVVQGADGHFCAGGDIAEYPSFRFDSELLARFHEQEVWGGLQSMLDCDVPILALIDGNCMGAGLEIASCCDIRLAASTARFGAPIARLGFPMAPREAALVAGAVGPTIARAMLLAAEVFGAPDLLACGFLTRVFDADALDAQATAWTERVAALAPQAARMNKQTLRMFCMPNQPAARIETAQVAPETIANPAYGYADSAEHREGIDAFLNKRKPEF